MIIFFQMSVVDVNRRMRKMLEGGGNHCYKYNIFGHSICVALQTDVFSTNGGLEEGRV